MSAKKAIKVRYDGFTYIFTADLNTKKVILLTRVQEGTPDEILIEMNSVPDRVQIAFYVALNRLIDEHNRTSASRVGKNT